MSLALLLSTTQIEAMRAIFWIAVAIAAGLVVHLIARALLTRFARRSNSPFLGAVVRRTERSAAFIVPMLAILIVLPEIVIPEDWKGRILHVAAIMTIVAVGWAAVAFVRLTGDVMVARHRIDVDDNLLARQLSTRVAILTRVAIILISLVVLSSVLMTFPPIRALGTTLLASAGIAGIAIGIAARPLFENLVAGVQLALTQPIRLDDVVIVEKQFGRIEELHATYVVVRLWDLRRMVLPLTYFINTPFENWTRRTANLIGEVHVIADWTLDVDALRAEIPRIAARSPLWDKQVQNTQVVDATDKGIDVRVLVSAANSSDLWDLRCFVREQIVAYLRDNQPDAFPRVRIEAPSSEPSGEESARPDAWTMPRVEKG